MSKLDILPIISNSLGRYCGIVELILSILKLEQKLSNPTGQSEYFRWAITSHSERLSAFQKKYESIRSEYNESTIESLLQALKTEEKCLREIGPNMRPLFARELMRSATIGRINKLSDFIQIKATINELPPLSELKRDPDLLLKVLK